MEGLEYGYDDGPTSSLVTHSHINEDGTSDHRETADERRIRKEEKRAAKLKRKEEKAAKKARKESRKVGDEKEPDTGLVNTNEESATRADGETEVEGRVNDEASNSAVGPNTEFRPTITMEAADDAPDTKEVKKGKKASKKRKHEDVVVSSQDVENAADPQADADTIAISTTDERDGIPIADILVEETNPDEMHVAKKSKKAKSKAQQSTDAPKSRVSASPVVEISSSTTKTPSATGKKRSKETKIVPSEPIKTPAAGPSRARSSQTSQSAEPSLVQSKEPRRSKTSRKQEVKETDEELRRKFRDVGAMNHWLASQWRPYSELTRLQSLGILTYTRGKFDEGEKGAIKGHLELFKRINRMGDDELISIIMGKGRASERGDYPKFWPEVAAVAPGRPVKAVKDFVRREYDPRGRKGAWTVDEDEELLRAYEVHPNEWTKIANMVERTETDCRDRYKNQLASLSTRNTGHWSTREETKLARIVQEVNEQVGNDPLGYEAPWDIVSEKMGGLRSRMQCRKKWQDGLRMREMSKGGLGRFSSGHRPFLVKRLKRLNVDSEEDVEWDTIREGSWTAYTVPQLRMGLRRMKRDIPNADAMPWDRLLDELERKYPLPNDTQAENQMMKIVRSLEFVMSDDELPEEPEEEEGAMVTGTTPSSSDFKKKPTTYGRQTPTKSPKTVKSKKGKSVSREEMEMEEDDEAVVSGRRANEFESEEGEGEGEGEDDRQVRDQDVEVEEKS